MKVLVLAPPLASAGGIQRYSATLMRALGDLLGDQHVRCVAIPETADRHEEGRFPLRSKLRFGWRALREAAGWQPDLIICIHVALGPIGWLLASLGRRPYWIVVHGIEAWAALPTVKRAALRRAERVLVTSAFSREQVVKLHQIDSKRLRSLPCTLDQSLVSVEPQSEGLLQRVSNDRRVVLTVARMAAAERYKGHDVVLRALPSVVAQVPNLTYVIAGDGDDRPRLEGLTDELGLRNHVVFTGEVSDSELAAVYRRSDVFVLPARSVVDDRDPKGEGFGIVFLEAMAFGKPVVGPNCGAPAELIRHGENGLLVNPEDESSVAEALVDLLTNPERAREMGQAGAEWVQTHHAYGSFRDQLAQMLADHPRVLRLSAKDTISARAELLLATLFALWVLAINVLYYAQFKALFIARLGHLFSRWR